MKVGVKDNQTTNTQVTAIMRDVGPQNYSEFNELLFCNEAVLWAVNKNGWALNCKLTFCLHSSSFLFCSLTSLGASWVTNGEYTMCALFILLIHLHLLVLSS